jgi:hypothetical protein
MMFAFVAVTRKLTNSNAFSCDRYGVSAAHPTMSIFAEILSIRPTRVPFAYPILSRAIA